MKRPFILSIIILYIVFVTSGCSTIRSARIFAPSLFKTSEIKKDIYLDIEATEKQGKELLDSIIIAEERLVKFYGELKTQPKIVACATENCYKKFGGVGSRGKNYGNASILLSPRGINPEIITHEWSHRELYDRLGFFNSKEIEYWFNEGLAVFISEDERFTHDKWESATQDGKSAPGLDDINTLRKWIKENRKKEHIMSYGTAREEVARWIEKAGIEGLRELIKRLSEGDDFYTAYFAIANIDSTFLKRKTYNQTVQMKSNQR